MENNVKENGLTPSLKKDLKQIKLFISLQKYIYADEKKIIDKIDRIIEGPKEFVVNTKDILGKVIFNSTNEFSSDNLKAFIKLLKHFSKGENKSVPTKTWLSQSRELIKQLPSDDLVGVMGFWMKTTIDLLKEIHKVNSWDFKFLYDENIQLLRSAIWSGSIINNEELNQTIEDLGLWCFKKLPSHGAVSVKLGNACIYSFSKLPYQDGISRLTKFRMKIKYPSVHKIITKAIESVAETEGKTMYEIEELAVQDYGFDDTYQLVQEFGEYRGIATIINSHTISLAWENDKGKIIKTIPKYIKENYADQLKEFKKHVKDIQSNLSVQKQRIEKMYLAKRQWLFSNWKELYLDNNFLAFFSTKLIWSFTNNDKTVNAIYHNNQFISVQCEMPFDYNNSKVELWHPINSEIDEVSAWRHWLVEHSVKQPFKQAHREIYIVTDAELSTNTYSNRFAAHIVRQHIFNALCRERGWSYQLQGQWDSFNIPTLKIPVWNYRIEFWVETEAVHDYANDSGIYNYLQTDQVRFYDANSQIEMANIPSIVFSEVMRDVDLFVGVTSIGADPNWRDRGEELFQGYWSSFSFGDLSTNGKERLELLKSLIPKLKISQQCSFEGNFLVVSGDKRTYKIHAGSGNILMKPNDQYLCIVADRSKNQDTIFLPFEGDNMLSMIISKALLLAEDTKITDKTILSQINR